MEGSKDVCCRVFEDVWVGRCLRMCVAECLRMCGLEGV